MIRIFDIFIATALLFTFHNKISCQVYFESRVELNPTGKYSYKKVIPIEENGFIIQSLSNDHEEGHRVLKFDHYDTSIEIKGTIKHLLQKDLKPFKVIKENNRLFSVFQGDNDHFVIVFINYSTFKKTHIAGRLTEKGKIEKIIINGDHAFLYATGWYNNYLYSISLKTGKTTYNKLNAYSIGLDDFSNIEIFPDNSPDSIYLFASSNQKEYKYSLQKYGTDLIRDKKVGYIFKDTSNLCIKKIEFLKFAKKEPILIGTYNSDHNQTGTKGVFFWDLNSEKCFKKEYIKINDFLSYLPEEDRDKQEKKIMKNSSYDPNIKTVFHSYISDYSEIYLITEFYHNSHYPEYFDLNKETGYLSIGQRSSRGMKQFTHFVLWKFNKSGELEFSKQFDFWPSYRLSSEEFNVSVDIDDENHINLLYPDRDKMASYKMSNEGEIISGENEQPIIMNNDHDFVRHSVAKLEYWYNNKYLVFGYQKIDNEIDKEGRRDVFYLCKVSF